jgi:hypothetical protein
LLAHFLYFAGAFSEKAGQVFDGFCFPAGQNCWMYTCFRSDLGNGFFLSEQLKHNISFFLWFVSFSFFHSTFIIA